VTLAERGPAPPPRRSNHAKGVASPDIDPCPPFLDGRPSPEPGEPGEPSQGLALATISRRNAVDSFIVTYSSTTYRLLISTPGDIPAKDIAAASEAINRWNAIYGQQFGAVVVPTHWKLHSAAAHGDRPQASLNTQLVEHADIVVALFWHRLGSPTGEEVSGTVEEINTAHKNGAYVAILRCDRDLPHNADLEQVAGLRRFYEQVASSSLMLGYGDEADLARHVDTILMAAVSRDSARAEAAAERQQAGAEVWPRVESSERLKTDSRGRVKSERQWQLVLANTGTEPARNVQHRLEPEAEGDDLPLQQDDDRLLETLAPRGEASYGLFMHMGVAPQARCVVTWEDSAGSHQHSATLRFF
jgi:hypothetical protein